MFGTNSVRFGRESERKKERKKARGQKYREHAWLNDRHREGKMSRAAERKCYILGHNNKHVRFFSHLAANSAHKYKRTSISLSVCTRSSENQSSPLSWLVVSSARLPREVPRTFCAHLLSFLLSVKSLTAASFFSQTTHSRWCFRARQRANTSQSTTIVARKPFFMRLPRLSPHRIPKETRRARAD